MARLQILELPEGDSDDRPPFVLVVDQADGTTLDSLREQATRHVDDPAMYNPIADQVGARAVLVFEETVDIPANETPVDPDGYPLKIRVEGDFEQFHEQIQGEVYAAQEAIRRGIRYVKDHYGALSTGRPTRPDGTPYNYNEIVAGGWHHCDGCHAWGQWTVEKPHDCINSQAVSATPGA